MKKWLSAAALALAGLGAFPDLGEAGPFRRRFQTTPVCPVCPPAPPCCPPAPGAPPVVMPAPTAPARTVVIEGVIYELMDTGEKDAKRDQPEKETVEAAKGDIPESDRFKGTARRVAKTTVFVSPNPPEPFANVSALLATLPKDSDMTALNISSAPGSNRVDAEKRNVVLTAFLYAYSKEDDNDYHIILGDPPTVPAANRKYMNVEVSGIPVGGTNANRDQLSAARAAFKSKLGLGNNGPASYVKPNPPVPVRVTGSLFYDVDHSPPAQFVGPVSHKPKTAWEIHPVSKIEFLPPPK